MTGSVLSQTSAYSILNKRVGEAWEGEAWEGEAPAEPRGFRAVFELQNKSPNSSRFKYRTECGTTGGSAEPRRNDHLATLSLPSIFRAMKQSPGGRLRALASQGIVPVPGAPSALAARLIAQHGFPAMYLSGAAFSASVLGLPDVGLFTLTELVQQATWLTRSVDLPLIVDADTGFGEAIQVERTVRELEAAGVAAIQLEDQQLPKRCGHLSGKTLVDAGAMCAKLRAASAARENPELIIIARTDARACEGLDAAMERASRYLEAGADWIFPEALESADEFDTFARRVPAPLLANMTEFGKSPLLTVPELAELGYAAVLFPVTLLRVAMKAMDQALATLRAEQTQTSLLEQMQTRQELYQVLNYRDFEQRDQAYFGGEQATDG